MNRSFAPASLLIAALLLPPGGSASAATALKTVQVASGLDRPLFVTHAPGDFGRIFLAEQTGRIRILDLATTTVLGTAFLDLGGIVSCCGERGLLGLAFHPAYQTNGFFYVNYTNNAGSTVV
ncbi:MAG: PQQ-dependent sugar dehydrogenase, partial [Myxococcota bacterium]